MVKKIFFLPILLILFSQITFALDTTIIPGYNGTQPFVRPMAGGQTHITWSRPADTTNFSEIPRIRKIFYELQFKKGTDTTWYQYFPGGSDSVTDSTSINDPATFKINANSSDTSNIEALEGDKKGPNYYGFGVKDYTDTSVTPDLNKHYLIHVLTTDTIHGTLFSYDSNVVASRPGNTPNTYFYRIRSRVEDSFNSVEVSPWFPDSTGAEVTIDTVPGNNTTEVYFYNIEKPFDEMDSTKAISFLFSPMKSSNKNGLVSVLPTYLLKKGPNSYYYFYDKNDTNSDEMLNAFENGIGGSGTDKYNTAGILHQVEDVFGTVRVDVDSDNHITIARLPIKTNIIGYFYSLNSNRPEGYISRRVSNFREMLYTNSTMDNLVTIKGNLAHEFQHLIHYGYDPYEETWVNEGCSGLAKDVCGYFGDTWIAVKNFSTKHGNEQLFPRDKDVDDRYGITALWTMFLQERFGRSSIKEYVKSRETGIGVFKSGGPFGDVTFDWAFQEWTLMNYLNADK